MSTITTAPAPAPQMSRTPLLVGIAAVGVLAVSVAVVPRIASHSEASSAARSVAPAGITPHDLVEHRADIAASVQGARVSAAMDRSLAHEAKLRAAKAAAASAVLAGASIGSSTVRQQVGGLAPTFRYTPSSATLHVYNGRGLVELAVVSPVGASIAREQVGGQAPTFAYRPAIGAGLSPAYRYDGRQLVQVTPAIAPGAYTRWSDPFVPPFRDPAWREAIARHYGGPATTPVTHEFH